MKIAVIGATGRTGRQLVRKLEADGHRVRALVRRPTANLGNAEQVAGNALSEHDVRRAISGCDAVISTIGPRRDSPPDFMLQVANNLIPPLEAGGPSRLLFLIGAGVGDPADQPGMVEHMIYVVMRLVFRKSYRHTISAAQAIRASSLDWTLVRAPRITEKSESSYAFGMLGTAGHNVTTRALAAYLADEVVGGKHLKQAPVIYTP